MLTIALVIFALTGYPTLAGPSQPVRVSTDLRSIADASTALVLLAHPDEAPANELLPTEIAVALARQISMTLKDRSVPTVRFFGLEDTYDCLSAKPSGASPGVRSIQEILDAQYDLHARVTRSVAADAAFDVRLWLESRRSSVVFDVETRSVAREQLAAAFADALVELLGSDAVAVSVGRSNPVLTKFAAYPFEHHLSLAQSRFYRLVGRRFGSPHEERLLRLAEVHLDDASFLRGRDRDGRPREASTFEMIEELALLFRRYNLSETKDDRFFQVAREVVDGPRMESASAFPQLHFWGGVSRAMGLGGDYLRAFQKAIAHAPGYADAYFNRALFGSTTYTTDLEKAIGINPALLRARALLAEAYATESLRKSMTEFDRLFAIREYPLGLYKKALVLWRHHAPEHGANTLNDALATVDELLQEEEFYHEDSHILRALILLEKGEGPLIEESLLASLGSRGEWPAFVDRYTIAFRAEQMEQRARAQASFRKAQDLLLERLRRTDSGGPLEWAFLGLIAAHLENELEASKLVAGLSSVYDMPRNADEVRARVAVARTYQLLGRWNVVARSGTDLRTTVAKVLSSPH